MNSLRKKDWFFLLGIALIFFVASVFWAGSSTVFAQANVDQGDVFGTQEISSNVALSGQSLQVTAVRIINIALGLLGIIALGIVLYGGFVYMTSGGSDDKVAVARKILINGTIGLVIILSAWTITFFILRKLGEATNVKGLGENLPAQCRNADFANNNPEVCFGGGNIPGDGDRDCAERNKQVLLVRGITPSTPEENDETGMNNVKVRVLFNNPVLPNDPKQVFDIYRIENGQEVAINQSFVFRFVNDDPAFLEARFAGQNGMDQLPAAEYRVRVKSDLKGRDNQNLVEQVGCGEYPSAALFRINTDGIIDNEAPRLGILQFNGQPAEQDGEQLRRGRVHTYSLNTSDNSGIGYAQFRVTVMRQGVAVADFSYFDIPKVSRGSKATNENPFVARFPLVVAPNAELFDEYNMTATVFDIDGNETQIQFKAIIVGANCAPGDQGAECVNDDRACSSDLQCASKKCINNQCVAWPVIKDVRKFWDGAHGNYITIKGNYFGESEGRVMFGYEKDAAGNIQWDLAASPACGERDLWHNDTIVVTVPEATPVGKQAIIRVEKALEQGQIVFADETTDNHGPIAGPNRGRFIVNETKRPGLCSVGVAAGNEQIPAGATAGPPNTALELIGTAFGARATGKVVFGSVQGQIEGWSENQVRSRVPRSINPGVVEVAIEQGENSSNDLPFTVSTTLNFTRPKITSIDPTSTTPKSYITILGEGFGEATGEVFLAPQGTADCRPGGRLNPVCLPMDTESCGDGWDGKQIIAKVPELEQRPFGAYNVIVERSADHLSSGGENPLNIQVGPPRPSICFFSPKSGPAPLPDGHPGLKFRGINFSAVPSTSIYFFSRDSRENDLNTWLKVGGENIRLVVNESNRTITTVTTSIPVINGLTLTPNQPALIRLKNAEGGVSNKVSYLVSDCRSSAPISGFQCCTEGPEEGFFKPNNLVCRGQTRDAGYVWRFTTGRIPEVPEVIEKCVSSTLPGTQPEFPSPAPWVNWQRDEPACINQSVVVRFRVPEGASLVNINTSTVKVYRCGEKDGAADCGRENKRLIGFDDNDLDLSGDGYLSIITNPLAGPSQLATSTWHRVEISKRIQSVRNIAVAGGIQVERQNLLVKRPCTDDAAYCFEFKTGTEEEKCDLDQVGVIPHPFGVNYLGVLQLSFFMDYAHMFNPSPSSTLYYKVWGSGSQKCSVIDVRGLGWQWQTVGNNGAKASVERKIDNDSKAKVTALENTAPESVGIEASATVNQAQKTGRADLIIDLGEPKVINFWPNCTESCLEAEMGMRFNRQMMQNSFAGNVNVYKCRDELCSETERQINIRQVFQDYFTYRFASVQPLEKGIWYKVTLGAGIQAVGSLGENDQAPGDDRGGDRLNPFSWRFRTTMQEDGTCAVDAVAIEPENFVARNIGEQTRYAAFPRTAPNKCSAFGQTLNPWKFGWQWTTESNRVSSERVAKVTHFEEQGKGQLYCGTNCLPNGSDISADYNGRFPVCGNGQIDPGEDCDINRNGETAGVTCSLDCLRPGNKNRGEDPAQPLCGNGAVEERAGEECDPRNAEHGVFCSNECLWKGSVREAQNATSTSWCGSGAKTLGEDCDIASSSTTTPEGSFGCSSQCLHLGTGTSQDWCNRHRADRYGDGTVATTTQCAQAVSVCGNGVVEAGEECEYLQPPNNGVQVSLGFDDGGNPLTVHAATSSLSVCSSRCLLGNICTLNAIPTSAQGGPRCNPGTPGCTVECRVAGSSVLYNTPSFCGDARIGVGEYPMCEISQPLPAAEQLGENPVQLVTAVGEGEINGQTLAQEAEIKAQVRKKIGDNGLPMDSPNKPVGVGDFSLLCGFTETLSSSQNLLQNRDGNFEGSDLSQWQFTQPRDNREFVQKTREQKSEGDWSMHVRGRNFVFQRGLPVEAGKTYRLRFDYKFPGGDKVSRLWAYGFSKSNAGPDSTFVNDQVDYNLVQADRNQNQVTSANGVDWQTYSREFTVPQDYNGNYGIAFSLMLGTRFEDFGHNDVYIDNVRFEEVIVESLLGSTNDCPLNEDGSYGVGKNSCCYRRPKRVASYPESGSRNICRNTFISVDFDERIDEPSLQNNILLVAGFGPGVQCPQGTQEVTSAVRELLALQSPISPKACFWRELWQGFKGFFAKIFGVQSVQAIRDNIVTWCGTPNAFRTKITYEVSLDGQHTTSTVGLYLNTVLAPQTQYGLIFSGGNTGVRDVRGVGIRSLRAHEGKFFLDDFVEFQTGNDICKIDHLEANPETYLFSRPNATSTFEARVVSSNRNQRIQSIEGVYQWEWHWLPGGGELFSIPASGTPTGTDRIVIAAKNLEGKRTVSALARVTTDISAENNHQGRAFSAPVQLIANFCENPWPPREFYPYEEGISFGNSKNKDGVGRGGEFNGSELPAVRIGAGGDAVDAYFNVSFSYCADANRTGTTTDDLPYLKPVVLGNLVEGTCSVPQVKGVPFGAAPAPPPAGRVLDPVGVVAPPPVPLPGVPLVAFLPLAQEQPADADADNCSLDSQCQHLGPLARCLQKEVRPDSTITGNTLKKFLFVNEKNDDAIGLQIAANPRRLGIREWYENEFPGARQNLQNLTIQGYDALTDGANVYINALNQAGGPATGVYNNIYIFSINSNAQIATKQVFEQMLQSLQFNINMSDIGYCLATVRGQAGRSHLTQNLDRLAEVTERACRSDFDCNTADGVPFEETNGICSNAKTKFLRDWERLFEIQLTQKKLDVYRSTAGSYPSLEAGSFVPGYSNSRWGSWNVLGRAIGGAPTDPLNTWTSCENFDSQTCWDPVSSTVHCPALSSVFEYSATSSGYVLHAPLEYFSLSRPLNPLLSEFIPALSNFSTEPWCFPRTAIRATQGQCGDGVLNPGSGEQCEPPGLVERTRQGITQAIPGHCNFTRSQCVVAADCGLSLDLDPLIHAGGEVDRGIVLEGAKFCKGPGDGLAVINMSDVRGDYAGLYSCEDDGDCRSLSDYDAFGRVNQVRIPAIGPEDTLSRDQFSALLRAQDRNRPETLFTCVDQITRTNGARSRVVRLEPVVCNGGQAQGAQVQVCPFLSTAPRSCNNNCQFDYGLCRASASTCGNGRTEIGEACDSGALANTYGHCKSDCSGPFGEYCGNGKVERPREVCDYVPEIQMTHQFPGRGQLERRFRAVYGTKYDIAAFCDRTAPENIAVCVAAQGIFMAGILVKNTNLNFTTHVCQKDPRLLCDSTSKEAGTNRHIDCFAPQTNAALDFGIFDTGNRDLDNTVAGYSSNNLEYYGPCVEKNGPVGTDYNVERNLSCGSDCTAVGAYCGDRTVQAPETCDDGNRDPGDGCDGRCKLEAAAAGVRPDGTPLSCGNGQVEENEACDLGNANGRACNPQYGRSCTYCSSDCGEVLTVDPQAFCGDNQFTQNGEQCDVRDGKVVTRDGNQECAVNEKGNFSCNQCNEVSDTCTLCQKITRREGGIPARIAFLNPLTNNEAEKGEWARSNEYGLYVKRQQNNTTLITPLLFDAEEGYYLSGIASKDVHVGSAFQDILGAGEGLVGSELCKEEYKIVFNRQAMNRAGVSCNRSPCPDPAPDAGQYISENKSGVFPFPTVVQGTIDNDVVASPALPAGYLRVVVRWTKAEDTEGFRFQGVLHNAAFARENRTIRFSDFFHKHCNSLRLDAGDFPNYWWPDCNNRFIENSVYVHQEIIGNKTFIQSMTIKANGGGNVSEDKKRSYAFFVEASTKDGLVTPIGNLADKDVFVDIYIHYPGQDPKLSLYTPYKTYSISGAAAGNPDARYWHVFNLTQSDDAVLFGGNGSYILSSPIITGDAKTPPFLQGKMATDFPDVLCYVPGEACVRE